MRLLISLVILLFTSVGFAQNKAGFISGFVVDENDKPLSMISVTVLGKANGITTNDSGYFNLKVAANKATALIFYHTSYAQTQINFYLTENEHEKITVRLERMGKMLETVVVTEERERKETPAPKEDMKTEDNLSPLAPGTYSVTVAEPAASSAQPTCALAPTTATAPNVRRRRKVDSMPRPCGLMARRYRE